MKFLFTLAFGASVYYLGYLHGNSIVAEPVSKECEQKQQVINYNVEQEEYLSEEELDQKIEEEMNEEQTIEDTKTEDEQEEYLSEEELDQKIEDVIEESTEEQQQVLLGLDIFNDMEEETCLTIQTYNLNETKDLKKEMGGIWFTLDADSKPAIYYLSTAVSYQIIDCPEESVDKF